MTHEHRRTDGPNSTLLLEEPTHTDNKLLFITSAGLKTFKKAPEKLSAGDKEMTRTTWEEEAGAKTD